MAKAIDDLLHVYHFCGRCIRSSDGQSMNVAGSSPAGCNLNVMEVGSGTSKSKCMGAAECDREVVWSLGYGKG